MNQLAIKHFVYFALFSLSAVKSPFSAMHGIQMNVSIKS